MSAVVISTLSDGVRTVTLNRPERLNAINADLTAALGQALREGHADDDTRVMILTGAGRAFCAGDDLKDFDHQVGTEAHTRAYIESIQDITRAIVFGDKVVVGAAHGWAAGGGFEWLINCDLVVLAESTRCFFPELELGVGVTGAVTTLLPRIVGLQRARALILLGEKIDADQALEMGLAWRVVPEASLKNQADEVARRIADLPPGAVASFKRVMNRACYLDAEAAMALETDAAVRGFLAPGTAEIVARFAKKR